MNKQNIAVCLRSWPCSKTDTCKAVCSKLGYMCAQPMAILYKKEKEVEHVEHLKTVVWCQSPESC